jgi:hypothetical protein
VVQPIYHPTIKLEIGSLLSWQNYEAPILEKSLTSLKFSIYQICPKFGIWKNPIRLISWGNDKYHLVLH